MKTIMTSEPRSFPQMIRFGVMTVMYEKSSSRSHRSPVKRSIAPNAQTRNAASPMLPATSPNITAPLSENALRDSET